MHSQFFHLLSVYKNTKVQVYGVIFHLEGDNQSSEWNTKKCKYQTFMRELIVVLQPIMLYKCLAVVPPKLTSHLTQQG